MLTKVSVLACLLFVLNFSSVAANPRWNDNNARRRSASPEADPGVRLDTNAKRFAAGLPPLPPAKRWNSARTSTASAMPSASLVPISGAIKVSNDWGKFLGYLSKNLTDGHFVLTKDLSEADKFSSKVNQYWTTSRISLLDVDSKDGLHLAGIITPGAYLSPTSAEVAVVGESEPTQPGDTPQGGTSPTVAGQSETAIWNFERSTQCLTPQWVNPDRSTPNTCILYDWKDQKFLLTGSPEAVRRNHTDAWPVKFSFY